MVKDSSKSSFALTSVRIPKTAEVFAEKIRKKVIRGQLQDGDYLPPEAQLMASAAISRPTLREAIRILEAEGFITVARGARTGAKINGPKVESVSQYAGFVLESERATVADVYEARLAIEPYVAKRLAEEQPSAAAQRLRKEADHLNDLFKQGRYVDFMFALSGFHSVLVELGGNKTLLFLTRLI